DDAAFHAARWSVDLAAGPAAARGARVSRSGAALGRDHAGRRPARAAGGRGGVGGNDQPGGRALYVPVASPGDVVLLRIYQAARAARGEGRYVRRGVRSADAPRFRAVAGAASSEAAAQGGA